MRLLAWAMDRSIGWEWGAIQGPLLPVGPALGAAGPPARLWGCRETLPHVSVWVTGLLCSCGAGGCVTTAAPTRQSREQKGRAAGSFK